MADYPNTLLLIDNEWREAKGGARIDVVNPATGQKIGQVAHAKQEDLDLALAAAQRAGSRPGAIPPPMNAAPSCAALPPCCANARTRWPAC